MDNNWLDLLQNKNQLSKVIETNQFDKSMIDKPNMSSNNYYSSNQREYVINRDSHKCQWCHKEVKTEEEERRIYVLGFQRFLIENN